MCPVEIFGPDSKVKVLNAYIHTFTNIHTDRHDREQKMVKLPENTGEFDVK